MRGTEWPCSGCGRVVAYRRAHQYSVGFDGRGGGKARVAHKCPHGKPCIFGARQAGHGFNRSTCAECAKRPSPTKEV